MSAYMVHKERGVIVGKFDSPSAAAEIAKRLDFETVVLAGNLNDLFLLDDETITSIHNGLVDVTEHVTGFKSKEQARSAIRDALELYDFSGLYAGGSAGGAKDVPAGVLSDKVKPARRTSRMGKLIAALHEGATLEELATATDYPANKLWKDHIYSLKRRGYGREFKAGKFHLVMPAGMTEPLLT